MMRRSEQINELAVALCEFQSIIDSVHKGSQGYGYNYSDLNAVIKEAKPKLKHCGLSVSQMLGADQLGNNTLSTILMHNSGQYITSETIIPKIEMKSANSAQQLGAAISYMRRYAFQAILGMSSEDNDAATPPQPQQMQAPTYNQGRQRQ